MVLECLPTTYLSETKAKMVSSWCRNLIGTNLTWSSRLASLLVGRVGSACPDVSPLEKHCLVSGAFLPGTHSLSRHKETLERPGVGDILQNEWPVLFKMLKVMKDRERLRAYSRLKETSEA